MFVAQNYLPGDQIFLFGFSRGAYTVRSLAGFINACAILKRQNLGDLPIAWKYYRCPGPHNPEDFRERFKTDCHTDTPIAFLGVWDTVGALGIPGSLFSAENAAKFAFHDTGPCAIVKHGCHALAIDEHRHDFIPTLWTGPAPAGVDIEQVWFAGAHADVGGGYVTAYETLRRVTSYTNYRMFRDERLETQVASLQPVIGAYGLGALTCEISTALKSSPAGPIPGRLLRQVATR
jgi:uncharacterized protein (DUF2235 family)